MEYQGLKDRSEELKKEIAAQERDFAQLRSDYNISPTQPSPSANQVRIEDRTKDELGIWAAGQMFDVCQTTGREVIQQNHLVATVK